LPTLFGPRFGFQFSVFGVEFPKTVFGSEFSVKEFSVDNLGFVSLKTED